MTPKRILVHIERDREWSAHLDVALELARRFGASVHAIIGFIEAAILRSYFHDGTDILKEERKRDQAALLAHRARFKEAGDKLGVATSVEGIEWDAAGALSLAGRFFDLIVVRRSSSVSEDNQQDISSECLRASGRPVLIVPQEGSVRPTIGKRILLAWNGSREAALALQAGYPFLTTADHVTVALSETASKYAKVETLKSLDVEDLLKVHGLNYEIAEKRIPDAGAGADIVALAEATESDMIVMGSFGRSWLRNWALGSATSAAQAGARVPILTQH